MLERVEALKTEALADLQAAPDVPALEDVVARFTGRKGAVQEILRGIGKLPAADRGPVGQAANAARQAIEGAAQARRSALLEAAEAELGESEWVDATLPARTPCPWSRTDGTVHPVTQMIRRVEDVVLGMGFEVIDGPWIEDDYHNFGALNMPAEHPARDAQDTFWLTDGNCLRTHTSPVQIRLMEGREPPIRAMALGRVFRNEELDASHEHTFHQLEGFYVDREVNVGHMIHVLQTLLTAILGERVDVRLRPSYFPFVEPGFEMDITFRGDWMELLGCGLIHPDVLQAGGVDPALYSGFAFGLGIDRLVMTHYGIEDIRHLMAGDLRFLRQFGHGVEG